MNAIYKYLTLNEVAQLIRVTRRTVYRYIAEGTIPYIRVGKKYIFEQNKIDQWIKDTQENQYLIEMINDLRKKLEQINRDCDTIELLKEKKRRLKRTSNRKPENDIGGNVRIPPVTLASYT